MIIELVVKGLNHVSAWSVWFMVYFNNDLIFEHFFSTNTLQYKCAIT